MKAIITGGHGFIGHHLTKAILDDDKNDVLVIDAHYNYDTIDRKELNSLIEKRIKHIGNHNSINKPIKDLDNIDKEKIRNFNPDIIYHLATIPRQYEVAKNHYEAVNNAATGLLTMLELNPPKFVLISTSMVYGDFEQNTSELTTPNPKSQYGIIRLMCEEFAKEYCKKHDINLVIIRPSAVYGERDSKIRVVGKMIDSALNKKPIEVMGPNEVLDFTYVGDLVKGLVDLKHLPNNQGSHLVLNLTRSDPNPKTLLDLANIIVELTHKDVDLINVKDRNNSYPHRSTLSIKYAKNLIGFNPNTNLKEGLNKTIDYLTK